MTARTNRRMILVGVDGSPSSIGAARWAADLAERTNAPLLLVHAVEATNLYYYGLAYPDFAAETHATAESLLATLRVDLTHRHPHLDIDTKVYNGLTDLVLVELSAAARMTVVGAHGRSTLDSLLLGSTALRVANHAHSPVTIWRGDVEHATPESGAVLVGIDGTLRSETSVAQAFDLASQLGTQLIALHARSMDHNAATALLSRCLAGSAAKYPDVEVERVVEDGNAATALLHWSKTAQLVVVGSHGRNRALTTLLGSTSQNLLHQLTVPLVICRRGN